MTKNTKWIRFRKEYENYLKNVNNTHSIARIAVVHLREGKQPFRSAYNSGVL